MPISGKLYNFGKGNIDKAPCEQGVYVLYCGSPIIYIGTSGVNSTIQSCLTAHHLGDEGSCSTKATTYRREVTETADLRADELIQEYKKQHNGSWPPCNTQQDSIDHPGI